MYNITMQKSLKGKLLEKVLKIVGAKKLYEHKQYLVLQEKLNAKDVEAPVTCRRMWQKNTLGGFCYFECPGNDLLVLYTHGGAFVSGPNIFHWQFLKKLQKATGATIVFPIYPKAPTYCHKDAYKFLLELCAHIAQKHPNKTLVFAGDSAGGNIALSLACQLKQKQLSTPQKILLFSPCLDLTLSSPEIEQLEKDDVDPMLSKAGLAIMYERWAQGVPLNNPILSPIFAPLDGLGKTLVFVGTKEILFPENLAFAKIAKEQKVDMELVIGQEQNHAWPLHPIQESKIAFEKIELFLKK